MSEHKSDGYGGLLDDTGRRYTSNDGTQPSHGSNVTVYDGYGNAKPGYMNFGVATEKKDN